MYYYFDWDPQKATSNADKHDVTFRQAATVFNDPNHLSVLDEAHSDEEERWITLGIAGAGILLTVVHTFELLADDAISIRIISARKATRPETAQYEEVNP